MQYPLSSVHVLIYETIHPNTVLKHNDLLQGQHDMWHEATQQVKELRLRLMNELVSVNGTDALRVTVHSCQAGCTSLINRLSYYITLTEQTVTKKQTAKFLGQQYGELQRIMVSHLTYLQTHFLCYFDLQQQVTSVVWMSKQSQWMLQMTILKEKWLSEKCEPYLVFLIFSAIENRIVKDPYPSYHQYFYLQTLLTDMETDIHASRAPATGQLLNLLVRNNFNHPQVADYYLQQLHQQVAEDASLQEKADSIILQLKTCQQLYCSHSKWLSQYPALTDVICRSIKQELLFCYRKMKLNALQTNLTVAPFPSANHQLPVVTTLSVGQLAVMVRLLTECGMIECNNQSELLKRLAMNMSTTKTAKISAESLRIKYYAPDKGAVSIASEYIHKMLNAIKRL